MFKKFLNSISIGIIVICGLVALLFSGSAFGWHALDVPTSSMRPTISPGSLVLVHNVPDSSLKVGDIITYINPLNPDTTLSHRIVKTYLIDNKVRAYVTKGDANKSDDVPITAGSVEGKVVWHVGSAGSVLAFVKKPIVLLPVIYSVALLLLAEEVIRMETYLKTVKIYRYVRFKRVQDLKHIYQRRFATGLAVLAAVLFTATAFWQPALALLKSNTVALTDNNLSVAPISRKCQGNNNTNVNINNNSSQNASTGSASVSNNATGGSASSGSASNSNSSNININITNC